MYEFHEQLNAFKPHYLKDRQGKRRYSSGEAGPEAERIDVLSAAFEPAQTFFPDGISALISQFSRISQALASGLSAERICVQKSCYRSIFRQEVQNE